MRSSDVARLNVVAALAARTACTDVRGDGERIALRADEQRERRLRKLTRAQIVGRLRRLLETTKALVPHDTHDLELSGRHVAVKEPRR